LHIDDHRDGATQRTRLLRNAAPDRTDADLQTDKRRDPVKLLAFTGARPGMKVLPTSPRARTLTPTSGH